ncbi:glutamate racemase [Hirschia litorea]|uniref:Glutamate racemase n=1 Tax=Hirschia litorea TaxID=1199156 RepID=A0ABW2IMK9_9PROT
MTRVLVFDSGVGGLSIVRSIENQAPHIIVDYAADAGFFPYGLKTDEELQARLPMLCEALIQEAKPDIFVMACNTASTLALEGVRARVNIPVVGTVPAIKPAAALTTSGVIGVLATPGTIRRSYLDKLEHEYAANITVLRHGTSGLVELAERYVRGEALSQAAFDTVIAPLFQMENGHRIDVLVLACTHFPLVRSQIEKACPEHVMHIIDTGEAIAKQVLRLSSGEKENKHSPDRRVLLTGGKANRKAYAPVLEKFGFTKVNTLDL